MKNLITRALSGLLCGVLLVSFAGCAGDSVETTNTGTQSATAPKTESPALTELFSSEQLSSFEQLVAKYSDRAGVVGDATKDKYMSADASGNITLARFYTILARRPTKQDISSVWHYTAFLSMASHLIAIADNDADKAAASELYDKLVKSLAFYKGTTGVTTYTGTSRVTYYGVNRGNSKNGANVANELAVYDDQMWIIMDLMDAYSYTGEQAYMDEAVRLADICLSAWDVGIDTNGNEYGGITWGPAYQTKHTCSNAPLVSPLVDISNAYAAKGNQEKAKFYLSWAEKVYTWTNSHLMNGSGVFGDLLGSERTKEGTKYVTTSQSTSIDQTAHSYNSGTMLSGAAALYLATGEERYLSRAETLAKNTQRVFKQTKNGVDIYPLHTPLGDASTTWFNFILFQGYVDLAQAELVRAQKTGNMSKFNVVMGYVESMQNAIDYAYDNYLNDGFLPYNYATGWDENADIDQRKNIMDQASAAETYALLSMFYQSLIDAQQEFASGKS